MDYVSRAELGWPASAAPDQAVPVKGFKIHYEGTPVPVVEHSKCAGRWTAIRNSHLANTAEGYSDVAYNWAVCNHGTIYEGRGWGKQTGANGSQTLNRDVNAILWMGGTSGVVTPSAAAVSSIKGLIRDLRLKGAGTFIGGHRDGYATSCPGDAMYSLVKSGKLEPDVPKEEDDVSLDRNDAVTIWGYKTTGETRDAYWFQRDTNALVGKLRAEVAALTKLVNQLLAK